MLLALALLIALVAWACSGGDSDDKKNTANGTPTPSGSASGSPPGSIGPGTNPTEGAAPPITGASPGSTPGTTGLPGIGDSGGTGGTEPPAGTPTGGTPGTSGTPGASGGAGAPANPGGGGKSLPNNGTWCTPNMIRVQVQPAESGKTVFNAGQNVALKLIVTNQTGPTCYVEFAPKSAFIEVFSGSDRYWGSADCSSGAATDVRQLQQGETQQVALSHDWAWTRSDPAKCATDGGQTKVSPPGGTAFYARGTLANLESSGEYVFRVDGK